MTAGTSVPFVALGIGVLSWMFVGALRAYSLRRGLLDQPKQRSSHVTPTPRGGGAGLVLTAMIGLVILAPDAIEDWRVSMALAAVVPTAIAGWIDDHDSLRVLPRFCAHVVSGLMLLPLAVAPGSPPLTTVFLFAAWLFATVSAINVINFMDGIDGLIGLQTAIFAVHLALLGAADSSARALGTSLATASIGFLAWNWAPARIFLGDVGSGAVAVLGLVGGLLVWRTDAYTFLPIFLPLFPVFLDATVTIVRRARRREPLTVAHRTHLYQRLANEGGWGHARVSALYGVAAAMATLLVVVVRPWAEPLTSAAYVAAVLLVGTVLDRRVPPDRRPIDSRSE